jgi:hypothetical protein
MSKEMLFAQVTFLNYITDSFSLFYVACPIRQAQSVANMLDVTFI